MNAMIRKYGHPVRRNSILLTTHNGLQAMLFMLPVFVPYYTHVLGLGFKEFLIGEIAFSAVIVLMEVPSGWLSDIWKRRVVLALGSLFNAGGFLLLFLADSFAQTVVAQATIGVGCSLCSGTNTALLYDTLLSYRMQKHCRRIEGQRHSSGLYVAGFASLAGGFMYVVNPQLPMVMTIFAYLCAFCVALFIHEPVRMKRTVEKSVFHDLVKTMRYALHGHKYVAALIAFTALVFGVTQAGLWVQQAYYVLLDIPEMYYGPLMFVGLMIAGSGGLFGHLIDDYLRPQTVFVLMVLVLIVAYLISGLIPGYHGVVLLYASSIAYGVGLPMVQHAINERVSSERRATILSTAMLCARFVFMPVALVVSLIADDIGIGAGTAMLGVVMAIGGLAVLYLFRQAVTNAPNA